MLDFFWYNNFFPIHHFHSFSLEPQPIHSLRYSTNQMNSSGSSEHKMRSSTISPPPTINLHIKLPTSTTTILSSHQAISNKSPSNLRSSSSRFGKKCHTPRIRFSSCTKPANPKDRLAAALTAPPPSSPSKTTETSSNSLSILSSTTTSTTTSTTSTTTTPTTTSTNTTKASYPTDRSSTITDILRPRWQNWSAGRRRGGKPGLLTSLLSKDSSIFSDLRFATAEYQGTSDDSTKRVLTAGTTTDTKQDDTTILMDTRAELSVAVIRMLGWSLSKLWRCLFAKVELDQDSIDMLRRILSKRKTSATPIVLLPSHRSHVDYLMLSYVLYGHNLPVPIIAAGDNLSHGMIGQMLRSAGAFFIRRTWKRKKGDIDSEDSEDSGRDSTDVDLDSEEEDRKIECEYIKYKRTVSRYMNRLMLPQKFNGPGLPLEFFIEGGRTRDGCSLIPKLGMLSLLSENYNVNYFNKTVPDVLLVPISMTYERVPEGLDMTQQRLGKKKSVESFWNIAWIGFKLLFSVGGSTNKGKMHVSCGAPLSLKRLLEEGTPEHEKTGTKSFTISNLAIFSVASSVQCAIRNITVVPWTSVVAACILSRVHASTGALRPTLLNEVVYDVIDMFALLRLVGGKLPNGVLCGRKNVGEKCTTKQFLKIKKNVIRCLLVLDVAMDTKRGKGAKRAKGTKGTAKDLTMVYDEKMVSPTRRLELSSIRNQWTHLLSFIPYDQVIDFNNVNASLKSDLTQVSTLKQCVTAIVSHRYRLDRSNPMVGLTLTERQRNVIRAVVHSAFDVYVHVGEYISNVESKNAINTLLPTKDMAISIQQLMKPSSSCDTLALDTLCQSIEYYRTGSSSSGSVKYDTCIEDVRTIYDLFGIDDVKEEALEDGTCTPLWEL